MSEKSVEGDEKDRSEDDLRSVEKEGEFEEEEERREMCGDASGSGKREEGVGKRRREKVREERGKEGGKRT